MSNRDLPSSLGDAAAVRAGAGWLGLAFATTLLASVCCVLPLVLVLLGASGAWLATLPHWAPASPWLSGLAWLALAIAAPQVYGRAACSVNGDCAPSRLQRTLRGLFPGVCLLAAVPVLLALFADRFYGV